jgi:hypothetical protein
MPHLGVRHPPTVPQLTLKRVPNRAPTCCGDDERPTLRRHSDGLALAREARLFPQVRPLVGHPLTDADTRTAAHALCIDENTVNDQLKSIFSKGRSETRRQLITNATS